MKTYKFTKDEERVIRAHLWTNPCSSGCALPEMERSRKDCDECKMMTLWHGIIEKFGDGFK